MTRDVWRLGSRLGRHRPVLFLVGWGGWVLWWASPVAAGLLLRALFDAITAQTPAGFNIPSLLVLLVVIELGRAGLLLAMLQIWSRWWVGAESLMRLNLLESQVASGGDRAGPRTTDAGSAVTVFRDDVHDFTQWVDTWLDATGSLLFGVVAVAVMVRVDPVVTVAVVGPLLAVFVLNRLLTGRLRGYRRADREATEGVTGFLGELFASVQAVKVAGAEDHAIRRLGELNRRRRRTALRDKLLVDALEGVNRSTIDLSIGLVLLLAAGSMRAGTFTVGDLAMFATFLGWLSGLPRWLGYLLARHRHAQVAAGRMGALQPTHDQAGFVGLDRRFDTRRARSSSPRPYQVGGGPAEVTIRGLTFRYPDGTVGLDRIDLVLPTGSFTVVTGPVGAGKSTLLRALLGLVAPVDGEVRWNGREVEDLAAHFTPPRAAYLAQVPRLFTDSLRDNLTLGVAVDDEALASALWTAAFDEDLAGMPEGLDTMIGSRGVRLSGGQVQRAAAARALVTMPELLVVDDLSSALDVATERAMWDRLLEQRRCTILAVAHRPGTLARADQVFRMEAAHLRATS